MSERFMESVKCRLTIEQRAELSEQVAYAQLRIAEAERDLKSAQTQIKSRIAADQAIMAEASEKIRSCFEFRKVECEEVKDFEAGVANVIRIDTGEVVRSRKLAPQEYQKELPLEETGASSAEPSADEEKCQQIKVSDEECKPIEAAYSGDLLSGCNSAKGTSDKIRKPFEWEGKLRTSLGGLHWGDYEEWETWELIPIEEYLGKTYTYREIVAEMDANRIKRGDLTGEVVTWKGNQYVLANPLVFTKGEKPVEEAEEEEEEPEETEEAEGETETAAGEAEAPVPVEPMQSI